jgi:hypothetical protein
MASRINYFFIFVSILILAIFILLAFRIHIVMNYKSIEYFSAKTNKISRKQKNKDNGHITRLGEGNISLQPKQCLVQIIVSQDQLEATKTELNKMVKTYANAPINAFSNTINQNGEKLFENYVIKFDDVKRVYNPIDNNQFDDNNYSSDNNNSNNPYNDITPSIHFITRQNNFRLDGLISDSDNAYSIVMKIIKYIGLQTSYQ